MAKHAVKRRHFLGLGTTILGGLLLPLQKNQAKPIDFESTELPDFAVLSAFVSESGLYAKSEHYLMGMLIVTNQGAVHENRLQQLRQQFDYRTRLRYKDGDRFKVPFAKACIDYFVDTNKLGYLAVFRSQESPASMAEQNRPNLSNQKIRVEKVKLIKQLVQESNLNIQRIKMKSQSPYGPSAKFKNKFENNTGLTLDARDTRFGDDLLQLGDFIGGCIYGDIQQKTKNKTKLELINYLKERLEVTSFDQPLTRINQKIKIIKIP